MKYVFKSEQELNSYLLQEGEGKFHIDAVIDEKNGEPMQDRHGNDMIKLVVNLTDSNNKTAKVYEYITGAANMSWKIKQVLSAVNGEKA